MADRSNEEKVVSSSSYKSVISAGRSRIIRFLIELNLFSDDPFWSSTLTYREQIVSTRLFIILLSIFVSVVMIYTSLTVQTHEKTFTKFSISDFERLEKEYRNTINVPCSSVSIEYNKFLELSPKYHEVCKSVFVSSKWISSLFLLNATSHNILDYRTFSFSQFRSLRLLCRIARQSVKDAHRTFNSTNLINLHLYSRIQFNEIASVLSNNLQTNVLNNERRTVNIVSTITGQNRLFSALRTNYYIQSVPGSRSYTTFNGAYLDPNQTEGFCDCRLKGNQCSYPAGAFYNWTLPDLGKPAKDSPPPRFQIPGLMGGCIPLDTIRASTLECLYNDSCVNAITLQPKICRAKPLNKSLTRFPINSTIGSIFSESLFVETWQNKSSFEDYFSACAPRSLSYTYQGRFHLGTIVTVSLSAFGGLVIFCQLISPMILKICKLIKWKKQEASSPLQRTSIDSAMMEMAPKPIKLTARVHRTIYNFNLFPSDNKTDEEEDPVGIISTRLYILLIFVGLLILGFYTSLSERNQTYTVESPSLEKFEELYSIHSSTLDCPCSRFSMSYGRMLDVYPRYHSICTSEYLEDYWLSYFGRVEIDLDSIGFITPDFRQSGQSFFDLIKILCKTANETVSDALEEFKSSRLVTVSILSHLQFNLTTNTRMKQFEERTISSFVDLIQLIRSSIQTNQIAEEMWTNLGPLSVYNNQTSKWSLRFRPRDFYTNSCSCALSYQCSRPVGFYFQGDTTRDQPNITVPGLFVGCYVIDSLLLSNFQCLYDENCVELIVNNYDFDVVGLVRPLNDSAKNIKPLLFENSRFHPNTTISDIFSELFIEDWINSTNFTSYYQRCAPSQCTYIRRKRFDTGYMLAIMLGFYGGLTAILEIILPPIVKIILKLWEKTKNKQIQTDNINIETTAPDVCSKKDHQFFKRICLLNLFENDPPSTEKEYREQEIKATRIYIIIFVLCLIAALLYSGPFSEETKSPKIKFPTIEKVNELYNKNILSLSCPCSRAAVRYSKFLSIEAEFNSICSSEYITSEFILKTFETNENDSLELSTHYRVLQSLCYLSRYFIENDEKEFGTRELITIQTLRQSSFDNEIESLISTFVSDTISDYRRTLSFIMSSFSVNQLLNLFRSNWEINFTDENNLNLISTSPRRFSSSNCSCAILSNCTEALRDDIVTGCFPYDGFRFSKLNNISYGKLNNQLFVERWINKTNYTNYFQTCKPFQCQYTLPVKNDPLFMLTTIIGLYGGLTSILHLIIGQSLLVYQWWTKHRTQQTQLEMI